MKHIFSCKYFIFFFVLFISFSLTGCSQNTSQTGNQESENDNSQDDITVRLNEYEPLTTCVDSLQISCQESENKGECIQKGTDQCMMEAAAFTGDTSALKCEDFLSIENKNSCMRREAINLARSEKNIELCDTLDTENALACRKEVLFQEGMRIGDVTVCAGENEKEKISCTNNILMNHAMQSGDILVCSELLSYQGFENDIEQKMCRDQVEMMKQNFMDEEPVIEENLIRVQE